MSIPAINWCIQQNDLPPGEWVVLFHLCHCHNDESGRCDPSQEYLAEKTNMGIRTVRRHLKSLEQNGKIQRKKRGVSGGGRVSDYYVFIVEPANLATNVTGHIMSSNRPNGAKTVHEMAGKHEEEHEEQEIPPVVPHDETGPAVNLFNEIAGSVGWPRVQKITTQRRIRLRSRLKDVGGIDGWRAALTRAARSKFLTGQTNNPFLANFDWLTKPSNLTKVMEGNYDDRTNTSAPGGADLERASERIAARVAAKRAGAGCH